MALPLMLYGVVRRLTHGPDATRVRNVNGTLSRHRRVYGHTSSMMRTMDNFVTTVYSPIAWNDSAGGLGYRTTMFLNRSFVIVGGTGTWENAAPSNRIRRLTYNFSGHAFDYDDINYGPYENMLEC